MKCKTWFRVLVAAALAAPVVGGAQTPQPKVRKLATIPADVDDAILMPNGRVIVYGYADTTATTSTIYAYDIASKRSTRITNGFDGDLAMSPAGDRLAFNHVAEDHQGLDFVATIPIDPATGFAAGPAQKLSLGSGAAPNFSPDGKFVVFMSPPGGRPFGTPTTITIVQATGGPERTLATYPYHAGPVAWSSDGKWIFNEWYDPRDSTRSIERVAVENGTKVAALSWRGRGVAVSLGQDIAFYEEAHPRAQVIDRVSYVTRAGAHGTFSVPAGWARARFVNMESPTALLRVSALPPVSARPATRAAPSTELYEIDVRPVLKTLAKR